MRNEVNKTYSIWEAAMLVLLMGVIYESAEITSDGMARIPSFMNIVSGIHIILRL
jgi:hypothetical protein